MESGTEAWGEACLGVGISGNERAGERAKFFTKVVGSEVLTEGDKAAAHCPED